jgi:hypothetical protein
MQHVATRLREVHSLRTLHKQLTQLLSINEQDELRHGFGQQENRTTLGVLMLRILYID